MRTPTDADILREDILTLFLNEDPQLYFLSMHSLKNGFKLKKTRKTRHFLRTKFDSIYFKYKNLTKKIKKEEQKIMFF